MRLNVVGTKAWISELIASLIICQKDRDMKFKGCSLRLSTSEDEKDWNVRIGEM